MYWAAHKGHLECFRMLLSFGANPLQSNRKGNSPMIMSALYGRVSVVTELFAVPQVDINLPNNDGWTPLMLASSRGHCETVHLLSRHPTQRLQPNKFRNGGNTALIQACIAGFLDVVRLLLELPGIEVNRHNNGHMTPLHIAVESGHVDVVRCLLCVPGVDIRYPNKRGKAPLDTAMEAGFGTIVDDLRRALMHAEGR